MAFRVLVVTLMTLGCTGEVSMDRLPSSIADAAADAGEPSARDASVTLDASAGVDAGLPQDASVRDGAEGGAGADAGDPDAGSCFAGSSANQFTFIDDDLVWTRGGTVTPEQRGPTNWESPVNYVDGHLYMRLEVLEKPSDKLVAAQLCMWQDGFSLESCSSPCMTYSTTGVYYVDLSTPSGWWRSRPLDYTRTFQQIALMYKDGSCGANLIRVGACGSHCYTGSDIDEHVPIRYHAEVVVVAAGATFTPPCHWRGVPSDW